MENWFRFRVRFSVFLLLVFVSAVLPFAVKLFLGYDSLIGYVWFDTRMFQAVLVLGGIVTLFSHEIIGKARSFLGGKDTERFEIFVSVCILISLFLVPELGLRAYEVAQSQGERQPFFKEFYNPIEAQGLYRDHQYLEVVPSDDFEGEGILEGISTNSYGFRDNSLRNESNVYTIMALGGSTTWGNGVSNTSMTYPAQLERMLNERYEEKEFEVINGGVGGYTTAESLINLQYRGLEHDLDAIILYNAYNDLKTNFVEGCKNGDYSCWRRKTGETSEKPIWYYSRLFKFVIRSFSGPEVEKHDNITEKGMESYEKNLRSIVGIARENDVDVIFSTMDHTVTPQNVKEHPRKLEAVREFLPKLSYKGIRTGMKKYNRMLLKVSRDKDVILVNNSGKIPSNFKYHTDHVHFTDRGAKALARNFMPAVNQTLRD